MTVQLFQEAKIIPITEGVRVYAAKPVTDIITNGFFTVDKNWTVLYWNRACTILLGFEENDILGKNLWNEFADILPLDFYVHYHKAFLQDVPVHFEEYWSEKEAWFDVITYHHYDTLSVSFKSSSYPTQPERKLKIFNDLYRFISEITSDCLWEWDIASKQIFWIDGGHQRVFGYHIVNALVPQSFWETIIHPEDLQPLLVKFKKFISQSSETDWKVAYRMRKTNGEYLYVQDCGHLIIEAGKAIRIIGSTQNVTAKKIVEQELAASEHTLSQLKDSKQSEILSAVLKAQEAERTEIGEELHDNINQILGATKLYIELAIKDPPNYGTHLATAIDHIMNVIDEIRQMSKSLTPPALEVPGMSASIKTLLDETTTLHSFKVNFLSNGNGIDQLDARLQLNLFRILQEQINNIAQHAQATLVNVTLSCMQREIHLLISDNGKGCASPERKGGAGLQNIIRRAELFDGDVIIHSAVGKGFSLEVIIAIAEPQPSPKKPVVGGTALKKIK